VQYTPGEWNDLANFMRPHTEASDLALAEWARSFVVDGKAIVALQQMLDAFRDGFTATALSMLLGMSALAKGTSPRLKVG
jgi:hypothetical protein